MHVASVTEMHQKALEFAASLKPQEDATVVGLRGDLGAGKTTFVKGLAKALGVLEEITSPTFVIFKRLQAHGNHFETLLHVDAYRLEGAKDIEVLGWKEYCRDGKTLVCVEWPERITDALPKNTTYIDFVFVDEGTRDVTMHGKT